MIVMTGDDQKQWGKAIRKGDAAEGVWWNPGEIFVFLQIPILKDLNLNT